MIRVTECEPDKCGACRREIPIVQIKIGSDGSTTTIRLCNKCRLDMIQTLMEAVHNEAASEIEVPGPGKDCSVCECPKCKNPTCNNDNGCPNEDKCDNPVIGCWTFQKKEASNDSI